MAEKYGVPLLGQIPIVQSIRENGDAGEPAALSSRPDGLAFLDLAEKLVKAVNMPQLRMMSFCEFWFTKTCVIRAVALNLPVQKTDNDAVGRPHRYLCAR